MSTILVVEDEPDVRANLIDILDAAGYRVIEAPNGLVGAKLARDHLPDMILCDITMPEMDGYEMLSTLRNDPVTALLPFIFLTARTDRADMRQGMNLGADDYLVKPFTRDELIQAITMRLSKHAVIVERIESKLAALRNSIALALPHEFRTPLTAILGYTELMLEDYASLRPEEAHFMLQAVYTTAQRLHALILNFLMYAELQVAGRDPQSADSLLGMSLQPISFFATTAALMQAQQAKRPADLLLDLHPASIQLSQSLIDKVVQELVSNAFKFSKSGQQVQVTGRVDEGRYILSVLDHGCGLTAEQIADIGAYLQFDRRRHEQQGAGLGLSIVKSVAYLQGGELRIESSPGEKTVVSVVLPLKRERVKANTASSL